MQFSLLSKHKFSIMDKYGYCDVDEYCDTLSNMVYSYDTIPMCSDRVVNLLSRSRFKSASRYSLTRSTSYGSSLSRPYHFYNNKDGIMDNYHNRKINHYNSHTQYYDH